MIDHYDFGHIRIDGKDYEHDIKLIKNRVIAWRYTEHHMITAQDIIELVHAKPAVIVCGIGYNGLVHVTDEVKELAQKSRIRLVIQNSSQAVKTYNDLLSKDENVCAIIHLTC